MNYRREGERPARLEFKRSEDALSALGSPLECIIRELRRRTRVVGAFPDGQSAVMLVAARLRYIQNTQWGSRCYLDPKRFAEAAAEQRDDLVL